MVFAIQKANLVDFKIADFGDIDITSYGLDE